MCSPLVCSLIPRSVLPCSLLSPIVLNPFTPKANIQLINQNAHPSFPPHPSLHAPKFLISVGGFLPVPKEPSLSHLFPLPASLPTLHIVGRNDIVVTEEKSRTLWEKCENSRVEYHDGGTSSPHLGLLPCHHYLRYSREIADDEATLHHQKHHGDISSSKPLDIRNTRGRQLIL